MSTPKLTLIACPEGPPPGVYKTSIWNGNRVIQAASDDALFIWISPNNLTAHGWYMLEKGAVQ